MATEAHLLTKSVLEHRKSIASKTKSWPSVSGHDFERRKTFAVEMDALARSSDTQRSFLSGAADGTRTRTEVKFWQILSLLCLPIPTQRHIQKGDAADGEKTGEKFRLAPAIEN